MTRVTESTIWMLLRVLFETIATTGVGRHYLTVTQALDKGRAKS